MFTYHRREERQRRFVPRFAPFFLTVLPSYCVSRIFPPWCYRCEHIFTIAKSPKWWFFPVPDCLSTYTAFGYLLQNDGKTIFFKDMAQAPHGATSTGGTAVPWFLASTQSGLAGRRLLLSDTIPKPAGARFVDANPTYLLYTQTVTGPPAVHTLFVTDWTGTVIHSESLPATVVHGRFLGDGRIVILVITSGGPALYILDFDGGVTQLGVAQHFTADSLVVDTHDHILVEASENDEDDAPDSMARFTANAANPARVGVPVYHYDVLVLSAQDELRGVISAVVWNDAQLASVVTVLHTCSRYFLYRQRPDRIERIPLGHGAAAWQHIGPVGADVIACAVDSHGNLAQWSHSTAGDFIQIVRSQLGSPPGPAYISDVLPVTPDDHTTIHVDPFDRLLIVGFDQVQIFN